MFCSACGHPNERNRFCVQCGSPLTAEQEEPSSPSVRTRTQAANGQLEHAKKVSRQYFALFGQVLRQPFQSARNAGQEQFLNSAITIVLLSLLYPLLIYIGLSKLGFGAPPFVRVVMAPTFYFLIIFALITAVILGVLRIGGVQADFRSVAARFGTMLVPAVVCTAFSCLLLLIEMGNGILSLFFLLGLIFIFVPVTATILSFNKPDGGRWDTLYALVIANVASGYIFYKVISLATNSFGSYFTGFGGGYPF